MAESVAPQNVYPEQANWVFERTMGPEITGNRGPQRFQEGVESDTDVPQSFQEGAYRDTFPADGRSSHAVREGMFKMPEETMKERAHVGSASWEESPELLSDFVVGTQGGEGPRRWEQAFNSGLHQNRPNFTRVDG